MLPNSSWPLIRSNSSGGITLVNTIADLQSQSTTGFIIGQTFRVTTLPSIPIMSGALDNIQFISEYLDYEFIPNNPSSPAPTYNGFSTLPTSAGGTSCYRLKSAEFTIPVTNNSGISQNNNLTAPSPMLISYTFRCAVDRYGARIAIIGNASGNVETPGLITVQLPVFMAYLNGANPSIFEYSCRQNNIYPVRSQGSINSSAQLQFYQINTGANPQAWGLFDVTDPGNTSGLQDSVFEYLF